ncbi:hypothetical protein N7520_006679 [Penicillium odoratum]|uniref:uncharacterized protein n=1 Tax=Penicillium odoratum TaxID=1167516 RepID=UPI0025469C9E|nr:uncharacterized protein N7520_006679 [Penicillium odoratum]KAJ5759523.1 hypothetical protein N7520_006679 [Penicillium odoratum]
MDSRDIAIRDAKRFVRDVVRHDWEFTADPNGPSYIALPTEHVDVDSVGTLLENRQVSEWRHREFDSTGSELSPQSSDDESEGDISKTIGDPEIELRRKRRRQMDEEMAWNEGLRMFMARRDVWSGARTRRQIRAKEKKDKLAKIQAGAPGQAADSCADSGVDAGAASPRPGSASPHSDRQSQNDTEAPSLAAKMDTSLAIAEREKTEETLRRQEQEEEQSTAPEDETKRKGSTETSITEPDASASGPVFTTFPAIDDDEPETDEELDEPLIPVAPPFLSHENPIRATINSSIYPSIYSKVVVQGMTPTVPVNLAHLTKAMVQGWKADGQWPPKSAVTNLVLADDATIPKTSDTTDAPQTRRKNSITNAMRKVFHMGANPFHRRGSSQDGGNGGAAI